MAQEPMKKRLTRAFVALSAAVFLAASSGMAFAQAQEDDEDEAPDIKFFRSMLSGLGLKGPNDKQIEYRERSPLVLPQSTELPPPAGEAQPNVANWPVDQEVQRRKEERAAKKKVSRKGGGDAWEESSRALRPDQLAPNRAAANRRPPPTYADAPKGAGGREELAPDQLGYKGGIFGSLWSKGETETAKFTGEPERSSLTDPPIGYRTPSTAQPYGVTPDSAKPRVPMTSQQALEKRGE